MFSKLKCKLTAYSFCNSSVEIMKLKVFMHQAQFNFKLNKYWKNILFNSNLTIISLFSQWVHYSSWFSTFKSKLPAHKFYNSYIEKKIVSIRISNKSSLLKEMFYKNSCGLHEINTINYYPYQYWYYLKFLTFGTPKLHS